MAAAAQHASHAIRKSVGQPRPERGARYAIVMLEQTNQPPRSLTWRQSFFSRDYPRVNSSPEISRGGTRPQLARGEQATVARQFLTTDFTNQHG